MNEIIVILQTLVGFLFLTEAQRPPLIQEKACELSNSSGFAVFVPGTNSRCLTIIASATYEQRMRST